MGGDGGGGVAAVAGGGGCDKDNGFYPCFPLGCSCTNISCSKFHLFLFLFFHLLIILTYVLYLV